MNLLTLNVEKQLLYVQGRRNVINFVGTRLCWAHKLPLPPLIRIRLTYLSKNDGDQSPRPHTFWRPWYITSYLSRSYVHIVSFRFQWINNLGWKYITFNLNFAWNCFYIKLVAKLFQYDDLHYSNCVNFTCVKCNAN